MVSASRLAAWCCSRLRFQSQMTACTSCSWGKQRWSLAVRARLSACLDTYFQTDQEMMGFWCQVFVYLLACLCLCTCHSTHACMPASPAFKAEWPCTRHSLVLDTQLRLTLVPLLQVLWTSRAAKMQARTERWRATLCASHRSQAGCLETWRCCSTPHVQPVSWQRPILWSGPWTERPSCSL